MHGPPITGWMLVVLCAAVGGYCLLRMRAVVAAERRAAGGDALMGLGMAAMALPVAATHPGLWSTALFAAVFGVAAVRSLLPPRHATRHPHHAVGGVAMVYMALAVGSGGGGHGEAAGLPLVTGPLLAYHLVHVVRGGILLVPAGGGPGPSGGWLTRPELLNACRVCMGIGMCVMLLAM